MAQIRIKKHISLNDFVFFFFLCLVFLSGYFGSRGFEWTSPLWNIGIIAMFAIVLLDYWTFKGFDKSTRNIVLIGGAIFVCFILLNHMFGIDRGYATKNITAIVKVIVVQISIMMYARNSRMDFFGKLKRCFWLFNLWGILNMIVLTIQINVKGFMMLSSWLSINTYYEDLCAGLFGYNGTHRLAIYMTFLFLYNQYIAEFVTQSKKAKRNIYRYNFLLLVWHFILSTQNDNIALYLITAIAFGAYIYLDLHWRNYSLPRYITRWMKYFIIVLFVIGVMLVIPTTRDFILGDWIGRILRLTTTTSKTGYGSTERLSILLYSLKEGFGYKLGRGIGFYPFTGDMARNATLGFQHFGISSMSSMVYLMGMWFYLFFITWFSKIYQSFNKRNDKKLLMVIILLMLVITFYTINLTSITTSTCLILMFSIFGMMEENISVRNENLKR